MDKDTQADILTELIAVSGELPPGAVNRVKGGGKYKEKLITGIKNAGVIRTYYRDKLRGYRITVRAKKKLLETAPARFAFYLTGKVDTNHISGNITRRLRLHRIADTVITMYNAGVSIFRDGKPDVFYRADDNSAVGQSLAVVNPAFYNSREFKELGNDLIKIKNARAVGVLLTVADIFIVYNTGNSLMKWDYKSEIGVKASMKYYLCQQRLSRQYEPESVKGLILGNSMDILYELIHGRDGCKRNYFFLDNTFDSFIFLTNDEYGEILLKLLCDYNMQNELNGILCGTLNPPDKGITIENDAFDDGGNPVLLSYLIDMPRLVRFYSALNLQDRTGTVICFDFQKDILLKCCGERVSFETIDFIEFKRRFIEENP